MKRLLFILCLISVGVTFFLLGVKISPAQAKHQLAGDPTYGPYSVPCIKYSAYQEYYNDFQRCWGHGYFTNSWWNYAPSNGFSFAGLGWYWPTGQFGIDTVDEFINDTHSRLFSSFADACYTNDPYPYNPPYPGSPAGSDLNTVIGPNDAFYATHPCTIARNGQQGAAYIVDTILGRVPNNSRSGGITYAKNNWNTWENLIRAYATLGYANFNGYRCFGNQHNNSGTIRYGYDTTMIDQGAQCDQTIEFTHPNGSQWIIKKSCGNITGEIDPLPRVTANFNNDPFIYETGDVEPGATVNMTAKISNNGSQAVPTTSKLILQVISDSTGGISGQTAGQSNPASASRGYATTGCNQGSGPARNPCFYWTYGTIGANSSVDNIPFSFVIPTTAVAGSQVCFRPIAQPYTLTVNENIGETVCVRVVGKPYLRVYSGDALAGSGFGSSCTPPASSSIIGYNNGSASFGGAGVQYAAQATSAITEFASASQRVGLANGPGNGLSFANDSGSAYGGNFGSGLCATDYFNTVTGYTDPGGTYNNPAVANGQHLVLRHDGNLVINGNIAYSGSGAWANISQIPSLYIIVRGNIYINSNVTQLDGVYIAQPTTANPTTTGRIYTCANNGALIPLASMVATCNTKLTVNGAFIAQQVKFFRTNGSARASAANEASASANIAEVFNFSPEIWLVNPGLFGSQTRYDSISSLPPVL